ncbi:hypothetical protein [Chitinophaga polysaccharea]|uniref:hypothetical protein n=1 Tax=Chitinophaga polysaccharea TaxID=1293035 RepID=UPI001157EA25|nr:hypothetical protein [Chitinophaga polysaccharea]
MKNQDLLRHIKRKTVNSTKLKFNDSVDQIELDAAISKKYKYSDLKDLDILLFYENETVRCFSYNDQGNACAIPIADPVLLYFNMAQSQLRPIQERRKELLGLFRNNEGTTISENSMTEFYQYFGYASSLIIMAMTSIEAFVNRILPSEDISLPKTKFIEVYTKEQAQRWLRFDEKLNIIKKMYNKDYAKSPRYAHFNNVKEFRDEIVHTKIDIQGYKQYSDLYKKALNFKYNEGLYAVREFINLFEPGLVEDCPCGKDF